jgi:hypothetical protein
MTLPGDEGHALVVDTDALHPRIHDELMEVVESLEGQAAVKLGDLLGRRVLAATGVDMLSSLHSYGILQRVPIANVTMYPAPNYAMPLEKVIELSNNSLAPQERPLDRPVLKEQVAEPVALDMPPELAEVPVVEEADHSRFNRIVENQNIEQNEERFAMANGILIEARMLADEANRKREQAYNLCPSLRPQQGAPETKNSKPADKATEKAADHAGEETAVKRGPGRPRKNAA